MIILKILFIAVMALVAFGIFMLLIASISVIWQINHKTCSVCGHTMTYKGMKDINEACFYMFHCEHCGEKEEVPVEQIK